MLSPPVDTQRHTVHTLVSCTASLNSYFGLLLYARRKLRAGKPISSLEHVSVCPVVTQRGILGNSQSHLTSAFHTLDHNIVINSQQPGLDFCPGL